MADFADDRRLATCSRHVQYIKSNDARENSSGFGSSKRGPPCCVGMEQLKAMSGAEETNEASEVTAELRGVSSTGLNENSNIPSPAAAAATASPVPILGVNPLDMGSLDEGVRWMMKGRVDSTGLAKYFPHTARDLQEGKVSPEQLAEILGAVYKTTDVTMLGDSEGNEISVPMFISRGLTMEALPRCWFSDSEPQNELSVQFSSDLENHLKERARGQKTDDQDGFAGTARAALRTTCAEWSSRLDQELFNGKRGSFLRLCPLLNLNPLEFKSMVFEGLMQGADWRKFVKDQKLSGILKKSVEIAASGIVDGAHQTKTTCWECETGEQALFQCAKCHVALYCSRQCQESAWNGGHKKKCKHLEVRYNLYTKSVTAVDAAYETGVMHGIQLNDTIDYNLLSIIYCCPVFWDQDLEAKSSVNSKIPAGPSMSTFYENLGRVVRGEWWLYANPDSVPDFCSKCTDQNQHFFALARLLPYDFFGYTAAKFGRDDPTFVTSHFEQGHFHFDQGHFITGLTEVYGATMSAEVFLELYRLAQRSADITGRKRWRRQGKAECLVAFRNKFHK